jgi:hypothetical protein
MSSAGGTASQHELKALKWNLQFLGVVPLREYCRKRSVDISGCENILDELSSRLVDSGFTYEDRYLSNSDLREIVEGLGIPVPKDYTKKNLLLCLTKDTYTLGSSAGECQSSLQAALQNATHSPPPPSPPPFLSQSFPLEAVCRHFCPTSHKRISRVSAIIADLMKVAPDSPLLRGSEEIM